MNGLADGQQSRVDVKGRLFISLEDSPDGDEPELMGYRYPETFRDVSILVDFELVEKLGGKWHLSFREVFAGARPTINWEVRSVRCQAAGYFDERALKQGLWTHRQDMAEAEGGGWFHAKDSFEAEWVGEEETLLAKIREKYREASQPAEPEPEQRPGHAAGPASAFPHEALLTESWSKVRSPLPSRSDEPTCSRMFCCCAGA